MDAENPSVSLPKNENLEQSGRVTLSALEGIVSTIAMGLSVNNEGDTSSDGQIIAETACASSVSANCSLMQDFVLEEEVCYDHQDEIEQYIIDDQELQVDSEEILATYDVPAPSTNYAGIVEEIFKEPEVPNLTNETPVVATFDTQTVTSVSARTGMTESMYCIIF